MFRDNEDDEKQTSTDTLPDPEAAFRERALRVFANAFWVTDEAQKHVTRMTSWFAAKISGMMSSSYMVYPVPVMIDGMLLIERDPW